MIGRMRIYIYEKGRFEKKRRRRNFGCFSVRVYMSMRLFDFRASIMFFLSKRTLDDYLIRSEFRMII